MFTSTVLAMAMLSTSCCGGGCCRAPVVAKSPPPALVKATSVPLSARLSVYFLTPTSVRALMYPFVVR